MTAPRPKTRLEMPFLLLCGMGFSAFFAGTWALGYVIMVPAVLFGSGPYTVNEEVVSKGTYILSMLPLFVLFPFFIAAFGAVTYGLYRERVWTRTAIMSFWGVMMAAGLIISLVMPEQSSDPVGGLLSGLVLWGVAAWYCYGKESVVAYFKEIEAQDVRRRATLAGIIGEPVAPPPPVS